MKISETNKIYVKSKIDKLGFQNVFIGHYSLEFHDIKDEKFHELRNKYLDSLKELAKYLEINPKYLS